MFRIYFITDRRLTPRDPPSRAALEALQAGVEMVQIREKDLHARQVLEIAREVAAAARSIPAEVYVNSRLDIAIAAGAHGVHLPADGAPPGDVRRAAPRLAVGLSTHSLEEARAAAGAGVDFITFGPVFETPSKAAYGPPVGIRALHRVLAEVPLPVFAIGGIRLDNVERVLELPVSGVALISAIAAAPDRAGAVSALREAARRVRGGTP